MLIFLHELYTRGLSYSSLNATRSALASFVTIKHSNFTISNHPHVARYLKGIFNIKPSRPRYHKIWDIRIVLSRLRDWGHVEELPLKELTLKLCMLLALLGAARTQLLQAFNVESIEVDSNQVILRVDNLMKTDRPGKVGHEVVLSAYPVDRRLCVVSTMQQYLHITEPFRKSREQNQLFLGLKEPHMPVSKDTIARWIREMLALSGIDVNCFKAHSVRAASVSAAKVQFVSTQAIMKKADWTREETFNQFYNKEIITQEVPYDTALLNSAESIT